MVASAERQSDDSTRLRSRPGKNTSTLEPGVHPLGIRAERDAILYIPTSLTTDRPSPLLVYVHGAGGPRQSAGGRVTKAADDHAFILLSPSSEDATWDAIRGDYGPDVRVIDKALARTFNACRIDPAANRALWLLRWRHLRAWSGFIEQRFIQIGSGVLTRIHPRWIEG